MAAGDFLLDTALNGIDFPMRRCDLAVSLEMETGRRSEGKAMMRKMDVRARAGC
jgi:hypothetical protein